MTPLVVVDPRLRGGDENSACAGVTKKRIGPTFVIPAQAGIHGVRRRSVMTPLVVVDPRLRGGDENGACAGGDENGACAGVTRTAPARG